jgi:hypothetical protein
MARAARCAGVTCTRHLEGVPKSNAFAGPTGNTAANAVRGPFMQVPSWSVEPIHRGSPSLGDGSAWREIVVGNTGATPEGTARAMASRAHGGKGTDRGPSWTFELGSNSGLAVTWGQRLFDCLSRASFGARCARGGSSRLDANE